MYKNKEEKQMDKNYALRFLTWSYFKIYLQTARRSSEKCSRFIKLAVSVTTMHVVPMI